MNCKAGLHELWSGTVIKIIMKSLAARMHLAIIAKLL